jgi:basic membrane lipoprotein Med (substrate-binding protein (PBP1-ABC) superfamily)
MKRVDNGVYQAIETLVNGDALPADSAMVLSAENDGVGFAEAHDAAVPQEATDKVTEILDGLKDGSIETGVDPVSGELLSMEATPEATAAS